MAVENRGPYQWRARVRRRGFPAQTKTFETKAEADAWERMILSEMDRGVFVARKDQFLGEGKSPSTVVKYLAVISHLFNVARKEWGMESLANPVELIRKPVVRNNRKRRLEDGEEDRLLEACRNKGNPWLEPLVILAIETAMRKGELLSLEWKDIDMNDRVALLLKTKNGSAREVPLSSRAISVLRALPRSLSGTIFQTSDYATRKAFISACKKAGIVGLTFHDLRHEATCRLAPIYQAQDLAKITGHKDLKMVLRYYHPRGKDLAKMLG